MRDLMVTNAPFFIAYLKRKTGIERTYKALPKVAKGGGSCQALSKVAEVVSHCR